MLTWVAVGSGLPSYCPFAGSVSFQAALHWSITCFTSVAMVGAGALAVTLTPPVFRSPQPSADGSDFMVGEPLRGVDYL